MEKRPKKDSYIVMSGQFSTLAMFSQILSKLLIVKNANIKQILIKY